MKMRRFAVLSVLLSVLLHLALFRAMSGIALDANGLHRQAAERPPEDIYDIPVTFHLEEPPKEEPPPQEEKMKAPELDDDAASVPKAPEAEEIQEIKFASETEQVADLLKEADFTDAPVTVYDITGVQGALVQAPKLEAPSAEALLEPPTAPRPEILEIKAKDLPPDRLEIEGRMSTPELHRSAVADDIMLPSLAQDGPMNASAAALTAGLELRGRRPGFGAPDADMPGLELPNVVLPDGTGGTGGAAPKPGDELAGRGPAPKDAPLPLDDFVQIRVTVQMEPGSRGGCFQVEILPARNSDALPDIPKDILFIIDRSSSISPSKFTAFRQSVIEVLSALTPADRFNVISFADKPARIFREFVPGTPANLAAAAGEIRKLAHGGMTDVFGGLAPFVRTGNGNRARPLNIFMLTDGQSTINIHQPNVFLREIGSMNPGNVSIFPFSADKKANRQLLDFLGYLNRGDKCHVESVDQIPQGMADFFARHASIIVMDVTCTAAAGGKEVFPKSLSHLYRSEPLRLFGRFDDPTQELVLAITGRDAEGKLRDLVFRRRLDQCPRGDDYVVQRWASQKILYLLARCNSSDNQAEINALRRQIDQLTRQYGVYAAY